jgi:2-polyprenyl-3-methyl-5-hydroxy-6-metoxy-1,4-benzoquinol methylase
VRPSVVDRLLSYVEEHHPRSRRGIGEARAKAPERFDRYADLFLGWAFQALGEHALSRTVDAFVQFSGDVNFAQARYEADGHYQHKSFKECYETVYNERDTMDDYLWGVYLTNFLWPHHMDISMFYEDRFLKRLSPNAHIVEIAPGHGGWGLFALHQLPAARLSAFDISPSSIRIAQSLAVAAGSAQRAEYHEQDARDLLRGPAGLADACVCNFLIEHLEDPHVLLKVVHHLLAASGFAFLSGALTAAQVDHIYEFRRESELVLLAEQHGLRVLETISVNPDRTLLNARFIPRSMSLVVQKRHNEFW